MDPAQPNPGSFRDYRGRVLHIGDRILRTMSRDAAVEFREVERTGLLGDLVAAGRLVGWRRPDRRTLPRELALGEVLEHDPLAIVSYPYEWTFAGLKAAALLHLDIQAQALERGVAMTDASAYNVQFLGTRPIFIDHLSFRPYRDGELWLGHKQFCEQFLFPLLLWSWTGEPFHSIYRGAIEGVSGPTLARLAPASAYLSPRALMHLFAPNLFDRRHRVTRENLTRTTTPRPLSRSRFRALLRDMRDWIAGLSPRRAAPTTWSGYDTFHSYSADDLALRERFVSDFVSRTRPRRVWDLGCNTGEMSRIALEAGAALAIGIDSDTGCLEEAFTRAADASRNMLALYQDLRNPSPSQGWNESERGGLSARAGRGDDAVIALAVLHHLVVAGNVPIDQSLAWLCGLAPRGVVELVPASDPMVGVMLGLRPESPIDLSAESFELCLDRMAVKVLAHASLCNGRHLYWYERSE